MGDDIRVSVIATEFDDQSIAPAGSTDLVHPTRTIATSTNQTSSLSDTKSYNSDDLLPDFLK